MIVAIGTTPAIGRAMVFNKLRLDSVNRAAEVRVTAAGKAVNVARVIRMIGHDSACVGIIGGDTGRAVREDLESHGVRCHFVVSQHSTRVCVTVIDQSTQQTTELVQEAPPSNPTEAAQLLDQLDQLLPTTQVVVCSGTISAGMGENLYATIARKCLEKQVKHTIIDAKGDALKLAATHGVIVKCNVSELCDTFGGDFDASCRNALETGASALIISDGHRPTHVITREKRWQIPTPSIALVSPIGSGDALAAGLAVGLEKNLNLPDAARLGVACAASNAMHTEAGHVNPDEVQRLFSQLDAMPQPPL